jgi:hypothetical protein
VFINVQRDALHKRTIWERYTVGKEFYEKMRRKITSLSRPLTIRVRFLDATGKVITSDEHRAANKASDESHNWFPVVDNVSEGPLIVGPYFFGSSHDNLEYWRETEIKAQVPLAVDATKDLKSVACEATFGE